MATPAPVPLSAFALRLDLLEPRILFSSSDEGIQFLGLTSALFVENEGQWDSSVLYLHQGNGANVGMTDSGPAFQVYRTEGEGNEAIAQVLTFCTFFVGAAEVTPTGFDQSETVLNYYIGDQSQWRGGVPSYEVVAYEGLYEGIDLQASGQVHSLKYEFHVAPGADPSQIAVRYDGIGGLSLADDGSLVVDLGEGWGTLTDAAPYAYQVIGDETVQVAASFVLVDEQTYTFALGDYDTDCELVIDPDLAWSTYLGGSGDEYGYAVTVDGAGDILATGKTWSSGWVSGGFDTTYNGGDDAVVVKISSSGAHVWSTYIGGAGNEGESGWGRMGVAVDGAGNVFVAGSTDSDGWVSGGYDTSYGSDGYPDGFVVKLSSDGAYLWATYLGGDNWDYASDVAVDASGNAVVTGYTESVGWVSGGFDTTFASRVGKDPLVVGGDAFVVRLSPDGEHLWSTYLGGDSPDKGRGIAVDGDGNVLVTGDTWSAGWVSGGYDTSYNGGWEDAFVAKLSPAGQHLWSTYLGGSDWERGNDIVADAAGNVLLTGETKSAGWVSGGFDTSYNGGGTDGGDAFVAKLSPTGGHTWSTYLGGNDYDYGYAIDVDPSGWVLVTGSTCSSGWVSGGFDTTLGGDEDAFVAMLSPVGGQVWSTYLGGSQSDKGEGIATDAEGNVLVTGWTGSAGWASGGSDTTYNGGACDMFAAKVNAETADDLPPIYVVEQGGVRVSFYSVGASIPDVSLADLVVRFGKNRTVSSITLGGTKSMAGLGIVIEGATSVGSIKDARKGPKTDIAFIAADAPIASIQLKGGMAGFDVNGLTLGGIDFDDDVDGDGYADDATAIYSTGCVTKVAFAGTMAGDVLIGGADAKGLAFSQIASKTGGLAGDVRAAGNGGKVSLAGDFTGAASIAGSLGTFEVKGSDFLGDLSVSGNLGKLSVKASKYGGGWFRAGANVVVAGLLQSGAVSAYETDNDGAPFGIEVGLLGKLTLGSDRITPDLLPFVRTDFHVRLPLAIGYVGAAFPGWWYTAFDPPQAEEAMAALLATGVNLVEIVPTCYQDTQTSTEIYQDPLRTTTDAGVLAMVEQAHAGGAAVMLKPHVDSQDDAWRGTFAPSDPDAWFASYTDIMVHYAQMAQDEGVEVLCVGCEYVTLSGAAYQAQWHDVVAAIRAVYDGDLVYAANHDEYDAVSFWGDLDYVGVDAYFNLGDTVPDAYPAVGDLVAAWQPIINTFADWRAANAPGKPLIITEVGYRSIEGAQVNPWDYARDDPYATEAQEACYEALFEAWGSQDYTEGIVLWSWDCDISSYDPFTDKGYSPYRKPAEGVLRTYAGAAGANGTWSATGAMIPPAGRAAGARSPVSAVGGAWR